MTTVAATPPASVAASGQHPSGPQVLLLKLPSFLAEQLKRASAASSSPVTVATMEVAYNAAGQQTVRFRCQPPDASQPGDFIVRPRNKRQMLVFTEKTAPHAADDSAPPAQSPPQPPSASAATASQPAPPPPQPCKFLAAVAAIADVVPPDSDAYRALLSRRVQSQHSANEVRRMDDSAQLVVTPQLQREMDRRRLRDEDRKERRGRDDADRDDRPAAGKEQKEGKRVRGERADVETSLLRLFSEQRFLTLKQLIEATQQPVGFLKEVVGDMCVRETKGDNKDKYQLKEKYRID